MPGIRVYTSNRLEALADMLGDVLSDPLPSPLEAETIVVRSRGMERWLVMRLAERFGVWANGAFPFPNSVVWEVFRKALPDLPEMDVWTPELLTFKIMNTMPGLLGHPGFEDLRNYLDEDDDGLKLFQLATRTAQVFDQYAVFRSDMVMGWDDGGGKGGDATQAWQAELWRALTNDGGR
ncbi:MAG: exodeoxyribonuclease V subunit gamma, partial [Deltaproteobacteria bacterium]|nr:exodeoxyribonuclease V subunit gamma [Deltaproteobacteria bacterium]